MDIPDRPVGRDSYRDDMRLQPRVAEHVVEPNDIVFDSMVLDMPDDAEKKIMQTPRRKVAQSGYDRNAHRYRDEKQYHQKRRRLFYVMPAIAFVVVAMIMLWGPFANQPKLLSAQQANAISNGIEPDVIPLAGSSDENPTENYIEAYRVASNRPRVLTIESLGIRARVLEVGTDGRKQPQLAKNSYDAGWYNVSVAPGEPGAVVVSGACSGSVGQGVFHRLSELLRGAQIQIERGDGTVLIYRVESTKTVTVDALDMTEVLMPAHGFNQGINLVGCTGSYDTKTNDFAGRIIVYAVQI